MVPLKEAAMKRCQVALVPLAVIAGIGVAGSQEPVAASLPPGVSAVWDLARAHRETTPTRERISINGLWRFQPADPGAERVPAGGWGHFKVPGCWPGITDYMQKDCQTVLVHPRWKDARLRDLTRVWYEREVSVPSTWAGRRIVLRAEVVNSRAAVHVDGKKAGEILFPAGEVDLTVLCRPGESHRLSLLVQALPLGAVMASFADTAAPREVRGSVARRGLCGDVWLEGAPSGERIADVRVETSVARWRIAIDVGLDGLAAEARYILRAQVTDQGRGVHELTSPPFRGADLHEGRISFGGEWKPEKLWDIHTPRNRYSLSVSLLGADGKALDAHYPSDFGFRELTIEGRDFFLNGTRIHLSALPLDNCEVGAAWASYDGVKESLLRLKGIGINFVYTHNYGCEPGSHLSFEEALRAADDVGMLVALSQPHFGRYDWKAPEADRRNGYARHAAFYARVAGNHPSVVFYSMSHNATGYSEDMSPDLIDGASDARDSWSRNNAKLALRAEAIVKRLDPGRIVYHHSSGNLGSMHTTNFYANFAPVQELDDWFEGWATRGAKPLFTCEYMVPCTWDWTMYRGWYKGKREFGSAAVPWDYSIAEWSAQFLGDRAYRIGEPERRNIRWEAKQYRDGNLWHRWDYPYPVGSTVFEAQHEIIGAYLTSNWRAFRAWGVSATNPWEHHFFWSLREGARKGRKALQVDWENLQRPGFSADYIDQVLERWDLAHERSDWIPTADGRAILRNNMPLLAYIAGKPAAFTSKDHIFTPGERFEKQIIVINDSREAVSFECSWSLGLPGAVAGNANATVPAGEQRRIPLRLELPGALAPGKYVLEAAVRFSTGETQEDSFAIHVVPERQPPRVGTARIALFDPRGESGKLLDGLGVRNEAVDADQDLAPYDVLVVGKGALGVEGPAPDIRRVRDGLRVLIFEQTAAALEKRFGFRVAEYGLRQVFERVPDHPLLEGLDPDQLRDWRGSATLIPPRLDYTLSPRLNLVPVVKWCDLEVSRVWRCGNRGNVASVLIEKPARGDFLPVLEGGYSLQYSPLMEYREGKGLVIFCQADVTGRTESDPAASRLAGNLLEHVARPPPPPGTDRVLLAGGGATARSQLEAAGLEVAEYAGGTIGADRVLVIAAGAGEKLAASAPAIDGFLKAGGRLLALGLDEGEARRLLPFRVTMKKEEHIAAIFEPARAGSLTAGVGPADLHNRDPREMPLVMGGATVIANGVLATVEGANAVFCQLAPHEVKKDLASRERHNVRRTYRRASFLLTRLLANLGAAGRTPLLERFRTPAGSAERRWLEGFYLDEPEEWDDPYRFFRW
jgi:beta-galactosidase/beta-glucuronidase